VRTGGGAIPALLAAFVVLFCAILPGFGAPPPAVEAQTGQLDALRQQAIAAAAALQQRERSLGALDLVVRVMQRGVDAKDNELAQSRRQQEALLGALERLAKAPPEALAFAPEGPVERMRSGVLIAAAVPALSDQARELSGQLAALNTVRHQIEASRKNIDDARAALDRGRDALVSLLTKRNALTNQLLREDAKAVDGTALGNAASDPFDLIKRADAASDQRDKDLAVRLHVLYGTPSKGARPLVDPTKPKNLRGLDAPHAEMLWPVAGELVHRFGEADNYGRPSQGLTLTAMPKGIVVAPFDGRVDYVGTFRGYGLVLIIRHGAGYHSLLAGLGHADVMMGQWLLAGEPVGSLPGADDSSASASLYLELRRDGKPVDPQSRLGSRDRKTEDTRVRE
jgi:septal ring factor EnvC (AmiA/AmiB activator)